LPLEIALKFRSRRKRKWRYVILGLAIIGIIAIFGTVTGWDGLATAGRITPISFDELPSFSTTDRADEVTLTPTAVEFTGDSPKKTLVPPTQTIVQMISTATVHPTWTLQPTITFTPPPTPGPGLGTPFGVDQVYVVYRVQEGQSLLSLSEIFDTSPEAIQAANVLRAGRTVWPGDIIVIPVGQDDPGQVVRFIYQFIIKKTSIQELAAENSVTVEELRKYNLLGADEWVPAGRWLIIPAVGE
jgi:hypothetical protein